MRNNVFRCPIVLCLCVKWSVGGAVIGRRLYFCGMVWVRWGCLIRLDYIGCAMVGWPFRAPFFISGLFGWRVMTRGVGGVGAM